MLIDKCWTRPTPVRVVEWSRFSIIAIIACYSLAPNLTAPVLQLELRSAQVKILLLFLPFANPFFFFGISFYVYDWLFTCPTSCGLVPHTENNKNTKIQLSSCVLAAMQIHSLIRKLIIHNINFHQVWSNDKNVNILYNFHWAFGRDNYDFAISFYFIFCKRPI